MAAKVIAFSINSRFESVLPNRELDATNKGAKAASMSAKPMFDIDEVVRNVLGFVSSSLSKMAGNGASGDDIVYFKKQAMEGVNVGIDQAKIELAGISDDTLTKNINVSQDRIIKGIEKLPDSPELYEHSARSVREQYDTIEIASSNYAELKIDFGVKAFAKVSGSEGSERAFTTQGSNISFSIAGSLNSDKTSELANLINSTDELLNTFYRKDMQSAYDKSLDLGYSDADMIALSKQLSKTDKTNGAMAYDQIKHLNEFSNKEDLSSPKAVAQYVARLMSVMDTAKQELASEEEYKQVINGLVNQMKDVQVPDLVQAINRFHAFNAKFLGSGESKVN